MTTNNDFNTAYEDNIGDNSTVGGNVLTNDTGIINPKVTSVKVGGTTITVPTTGSTGVNFD